MRAATREIDTHTADRADWLIGQSSPDHLHGNISTLVRAWATRDFNDAGRWLENLEPSPLRDTAVGQFARTVAPADPEAARAWAETISDAEARGKVLAEIPGR